VNELRLLGDIGLSGADGDRVDSILAQPKRLALLAYLALAEPGGTQRRNSLVAVFWPESAESNARNSLSQSLHHLRQALGTGAVVSYGTDEVGIDRSGLSCDALEFLDALDAGDLETALDLYRGDLLPGLFVSGSPAFERWLEGERATLRRKAFDAALELGRDAEDSGDLVSAARWFRHATAIIPERGTAVRHLMTALAGAGMPLDAVLEFKRYAALLDEDYGLQPSDETRTVVESIRSSLNGGEALPGASGALRERTGIAEDSPAEDSRPASRVVVTAAGPEVNGSSRGRNRWSGRIAIGAVALMVIGAGIWIVAMRGYAVLETRDPEAVPLDSTAIAVLPFEVIGADNESSVRELARSMGRLFELKVTGEFGRRIAHPGTVVGSWWRAGGGRDTALTEAVELQLGRDLGVGALVRGTVVKSDTDIVLAASMVDVATGSIRVRTVRAEGSLEERYALVDQLIVLLLSRDQGYSTADAPRLAQYEPEAVQAFLAEDYERALEADSSLVDAALWQYSDGEWDTVALRHAWKHQDQLTERGRAYLQVLAAGDFDDSITTLAQQIAGFEALTRMWPEWGTPWEEFGGRMAVDGALASMPDWRRRAREALDGQPTEWYALWNLLELAFMEEDTARASELTDRLEAATADSSGFDFIPPRLPSYRWRLAVLKGDMETATRALAATPESTWVPGFALVDGRGVADADRVIAAGAFAWWSPDNWAWARGRDPEWRDVHQRAVPIRGDVRRHSIRVFRALLLGTPEDSLAVEAIRRLERIASGADDQPSGVSEEDQTRARCWIALWRLEQGDAAGARETLRHIAGTERPGRFASWAVMFDVLLTRIEEGDVHEALLRADSEVREYPLGTRRNEAEAHNLILARLLREYGEPERALAAIRRRAYSAPYVMQYDFTSLPEYLREEARLAGEVGDTASAIDAYRHYFALRDPRPDHPIWAAQWDSMRVEYSVLTGVEGR
jgi:serine/threonine-protein kinase